ncbi:T-box protein H15 [Scaptodrosophila lebanonensis]|uniref:T-box protein H15 n=1 Tax=Drosophila lebanonensis TaxID=7225 RepID=A0A6J2TYG9_DROLE|nr:T-box protein H15 [Scaptodrosophila lebanonensis]
MLVGSHPYLCNGVLPPVPAAAAPSTTTTTTASKSAAGSATDFSIAAIMAREDASSRESSLRSASPISVEDEVDVDVVDCSDVEEPPAKARRLNHHHHHQHHHHNNNNSIHNNNSPAHINSNSTNSSSNNNNNNLSSNHHSGGNHKSRSAGAESQLNTSSTSSQGRCSTPPQSPGTEDSEERLTPEPVQKAPKIVGSCNCDDLKPVQCHLETKELWDRFHELGTEMIITKTGRRMFPTVRVSFSGPLRQIQPADRYAVLLDIIPMDSKRYRYAYHRSAWLVAGKSDPPPPSRIYAHPDSPFSCEALRKQVISFEKVKLTNNEMDKNGQIVLNSMHRYQPRIHLVRLAHGQSIPTNPKELQELDHKTYVFSETVFTAVTAYQNQLITKLKIDSNPFAKGFRDSSRLTDFDRDPMEALLLEQQLRSPLRLFPDPLMQQFAAQQGAPDPASMALFEKARQHLQMFGGNSPYAQLMMPQMYQAAAAAAGPPPPPPGLGAFHMFQQQWPQLTAGFLASANQQAAAAQAAAQAQAQAQAAAAAAAAAAANRTPPPPPTASTPSSTSSGSPSPDMRPRQFQRFSPYQLPLQTQAAPPTATTSASSPAGHAPPPRSPAN